MKKILYAIQGTGHGHVSRAREILPALMTEYDVEILVSGYNSKLAIEQPVNYTCKGISFIYGHGGISWTKSMRELDLITYLKDTVNLDVKKFDLVISDFEPVSAWAARIKNVPSLSMSHQSAFKSKNTPRPKRISQAAEFVMKHYAPCEKSIGFHFESYDDFILPPIIREEVRLLKPSNKEHITVYLPAFPKQLILDVLGKIPHREFHVFTPNVEQKTVHNHIHLIPVNNTQFLKSLESSDGLITSAGFESCAEAMYLGKKLLTIPILHQYEQYCNAAALKKMGVSVVPRITNELSESIDFWLEQDEVIGLPAFSTAKDVLERMQLMYS